LQKIVVLYDIDSKIPNLALMKISTYYDKMGYKVLLSKKMEFIDATRYHASTIFHTQASLKKIAILKKIYGDNIDIGGSGISLHKRLPPDMEACFPDYGLYSYTRNAIGFLTRGCDRRCDFCLVPAKEGSLKRVASFDDFVPPRQKHVMLLDDNLLAYYESDALLREIAGRGYAVNFSQSLDITYLSDFSFALLNKVDSRNSKFTKRMFYFSCNNTDDAKEFSDKRKLLSGFGDNAVGVISMYGFNSHLSDDYQILRMIQRLNLIPFLQEYWHIPNAPARIPEDYFDFDLDVVIRMTFRSNGQNWEKYLRWLNRLYFATFGRYYLPLLRIIYRYNRRENIENYLCQPWKLTEELYRTYEDRYPPV
jgi:hypothetical protein